MNFKSTLGIAKLPQLLIYQHILTKEEILIELLANTPYESRIMDLICHPEFGKQNINSHVKPNSRGMIAHVLNKEQLIYEQWIKKNHENWYFDLPVKDGVHLPKSGPGFIGKGAFRTLLKTLPRCEYPIPGCVVELIWNEDYQRKHCGIYLGRINEFEIFFHQNGEGRKYSLENLLNWKNKLYGTGIEINYYDTQDNIKGLETEMKLSTPNKYIPWE